MVDMNTTVETLLDLAKARVKNDVLGGEIFTLKDLFCGVEWRRLPIDKRNRLGSLFFAEYNRGIITDIEANGKTELGQQLYRKLIISKPFSGTAGKNDEESQSI
ncbi:MAG: single-stranded DNA-binding protein [Treponema sp.]|nr:single-stranded DNA-binding protein [Treponema sp.]